MSANPAIHSPIRDHPPPSAVHRRALELFKKAQGTTMTGRELFEQKVSFVYGNLPDRSDLSKDQVREILRRQMGDAG